MAAKSALHDRFIPDLQVGPSRKGEDVCDRNVAYHICKCQAAESFVLVDFHCLNLTAFLFSLLCVSGCIVLQTHRQKLACSLQNHSKSGEDVCDPNVAYHICKCQAAEFSERGGNHFCVQRWKLH